MRDHKQRPAVLTIAGFDPSGAAGTLADVKTIEAFGCRAVAVVTSITLQNSHAVFGATHQTGKSVLDQLTPLLEDEGIAAVKLGMMPTREIIFEVGRLLGENKLPLTVLDPVLRATSGFSLVEEPAIAALIDELVPRVRVITPNIPEAERITGLRIEDESGMTQAAIALRALGAPAVLIKGGHLPDTAARRSETASEAIDILDDGGQVTVYRWPWIDGPNVRGTGCMMSSAIAAGLAHGRPLAEAVHSAKEYVTEAILQSAQMRCMSSHGK